MNVYGFPRYVGVRCLQAEGHTLGCLANDFQIADYGVLGLSIRKKAFFSGCCIFHDLPDGISNVQEIDAVVLHKETASAWMRCSR